MIRHAFPPKHEGRKGFYDVSIYRSALDRYPAINDLIAEKAKENEDKVWLEFQDGRTFTYREIYSKSLQLAAGLKEKGVCTGDHVAIFALNSPEWILSYFSILLLGAIPVTVNTGFMKDPLVYNLTASNAAFAVVDTRLFGKFIEIEKRVKDLKHVFLIGKHVASDTNALARPCSFVEDLLETASADLPEVKLYGKDTCTMILTSGTTGPSKVVADCHAQFITTALFLIDAGAIGPDSVVYTYLPLFHIMALDMAALASMLANAKIVLVETFNPAVFWEHVQRYGVTHFHAVGPILEMLFKQPESEIEKTHGPLTAVAYCSKEIWTTARERFKIAITGGYGSTEVGIPVSAPSAINRAGKNPPGACGFVGPHVEVEIMDERGALLPPGKAGEIVVRPKIPWTIFTEYYGMPEATATAFKGLWFHTGDAGYFDDDGYLYFVDRLKDAIRRKGENISSYEVEQILLKHPKISEVIVVPAPSELGEDEVMAVIVADSGSDLTHEEVVNYSKENMPHFWVPRYLRFVDSLPRTPTGKIEKFKMRNEGLTADTFDRKK
ncbi:MAG: AMP-binding protein [Syntrophobacteraceae bacterium]